MARTLPGPVTDLGVRVDVPGSKSVTNRALVAAAVAGGGSVANPLDCEDTRVLAEALAAAGWPLTWRRRIEIGSRRMPRTRITAHVGNSGTGARLLLALFAATPGSYLVDGTPRLRERPMQPLLDALQGLGAEVESSGGFLPATISGAELEGGRVRFAPRVSSQFVSALLMMAPLTRQGLVVELVGEIPSRPYLDLTEDVLTAFGARVERDEEGRRWRVAPGPLAASSYDVEGDWSAAAFFLAAAAVAGGTVDVGPLRADSRQGDRVLPAILEQAGCRVAAEAERVRVSGPAEMPVHADLRDAPDLFPALVVVAACTPPGSVLSGLDHLRHKESDRLAVMVANLRRLGADVVEDGGSLRVCRAIPSAQGPPPEVTAAGDHRIAMAMAVAALRAGPLVLDDDSCVQKSFPGFWDRWKTVVR